MEQTIPSYLSTHPTSTVSPPVSTRAQELPFGSLHWEDFERLCLRLVQLEADVEHCQLYGEHGQDQSGIDIFARTGASEKYRVYQCKRERDYGPAKIKAAVDEFTSGEWANRTEAFVLCTQESLRATQRAGELEGQAELLRERGVSLVSWDSEALSLKLKAYPEIVDDFFGRAWVKEFCGEDAAAGLGARLDASEVARLRLGLGAFYRRLFRQHDPGLPSQAMGTAFSIGVEHRYVLPDIEDTTSVSVGSGPERGPVSTESGAGEEAVPQQLENEAHPRQGPSPTASLTYERRQSVETWLTQRSRSIVLGDAGTGKSTLLRFLVIDLLSESPTCATLASRWGRLLPIWFPFAFWTRLVAQPATAESSLSDAIHKWFQSLNEEALWPLVEKAIKDQRLLLLVDGLDEWTNEDAARVAFDRLLLFVGLREDLSAVLTSRPLGYSKLAAQVSDWQSGRLCELSLPQQAQLCRKWFAIRASLTLGRPVTDTETQRVAGSDTESFLSELRHSSDLTELSRNPLLLSLLIYLKLRDVRLPHSRFQAYGDIVDQVVSVHPARRRVAASITEPRQLGISNHEIRQTLAYLAFTVQCSRPEGMIGNSDAQTALKSFLEGNLGLAPREASVTSWDLLRLTEGEVGILVEKAPQEIGFFHKALQEFLAAEHLSRQPISQQEEVVQIHCCDPQWHEVILGLVFHTTRPEDITKLVRVIQSKKTTSHDDYLLRRLLAQVAFGSSGCDIQLTRQLAAEAFEEIELGQWHPQRKALLRSAFQGLGSTKTRELVKARMAQWFPSRSRWRRTLYAAMAEWPLRPEVVHCLWRGMHDEDTGNQRAASSAIAKIAGGNLEVYSRLKHLARSALDASIAAAALKALLDGWAIDAELTHFLECVRFSASPELKFVGIAARIAQGKHTEEDQDGLLGLASRDGGFDYNWKEDLVPALIKGWPGSVKLKQTCLEAVWHSGYDEGIIDKGLGFRVLVAGYPQDNDVAAYCAKEIANEQYPFLGMGMSDIDSWQLMACSFRQHPQLVAVIDKYLLTKDIVGPEEAAAAMLALTPTAKQKMLEFADRGFLHWSASALLQGWGMADSEVAARLSTIAWGDAAKASDIGHLLPKIIQDGSRCRQRLLELLRHPACSRPDFVADGLRQVGIPPEHTDEVLDAVMGAIPDCNNMYYSEVIGTLFCALPHHNRVRKLAEEEVYRKDAPLAAIAKAYSGDKEMRRRIMEVANPLPTDLRLQMAVHLGEKLHDRQFALSILGQYDDEENEAVRVQASVGYYSHLREAGQDTRRAIENLSRDIVCYGPVHEGRRGAAFCALVILDRLDIMKVARETIGDEPRCTIDAVGWPYHPNVPLCRFICANWETLKTSLGDELHFRLSGKMHRSEVGLWRSLARVANEYPAARDDTLSFLESAKHSAWGPHELDVSVLRFLSRAKPRSSLLLDYCLKALFEDRDGTLGTLERVVVAAEILSAHFGGRQDVLLRMMQNGGCDPLDDAWILSLCDGWPKSTELGEIVDLVRKAKQPPISWASLVWLRCLRSKPEVLLDFLRKMLNGYSTFWKLQYFGTSRPIILRLSTDDELLALMVTGLKASSSSAERVTFARLLGAARPGNSEFREWCLRTLDTALADRQVVEVGFDLTVGDMVPLPHVLMDILHGA